MSLSPGEGTMRIHVSPVSLSPASSLQTPPVSAVISTCTWANRRYKRMRHALVAILPGAPLTEETRPSFSRRTECSRCVEDTDLQCVQQTLDTYGETK